MIGGFDPISTSRAAREGRLYPPREGDLARFGKHGLWRAGAEALRVAIETWWVGEETVVASTLAEACKWLSEPDDRGRPWGDPAIFYEAQHRHARAVAAWMSGQESKAYWREAVNTYDRLAGEAEAAFGERQALARFLCAAMAGATIEAWPYGDPRAPTPPIYESNEQTAQQEPGHFLGYWLQRLIGDGPDVVVATLCALCFGRLGGVNDPAMTFALAQVMVPEMPLAPAYLERGWLDSSEAQVSAGDLSIGVLSRLATSFGLSRDPDSIPQPDPPTLATWTRHPTLDLELDWHCTDGKAWLEARGAMAGRFVGALAELGRGARRQDDEALANLLTVPNNARNRGNAQLRWETLAALLRTPEANQTIVRALIAAGLRDPDWRVRMLAVWGVGAKRLSGFADQARSARLPPATSEMLNQDDRHTLLALRDAAWLRASGRAGLPVTNQGAGPGGARRAAFVVRIGHLFDEQFREPRDRHEALIALLRRLPGSTSAKMPRAWSTFLR